MISPDTGHRRSLVRWFPEVVDGLAGLKGRPFVFDGEICVLDDAGRSDVDRLHARARRRRW